MIWTERTLCSTHAVQLRGAKPHGLECGRERGYLWVCAETARGYLQRLRGDAAGSEALELRTAFDAVTCAADEEAEAAARAVARGIDVAGCATCSSTRMRGGGSRLLRWSLLLRSRRQDGGIRGGQVAAVRCCVGALGKMAGLARVMGWRWALSASQLARGRQQQGEQGSSCQSTVRQHCRSNGCTGSRHARSRHSSDQRSVRKALTAAEDLVRS